MAEASAVDNALAVAGKQLLVMIGNLEDGLAPMPTLWALEGHQVKTSYLSAESSDEVDRIAREAIATRYAHCRSVSTVVDRYLTDPRSGRRHDALVAQVMHPGGDLCVRLGLPYERTGDPLRFPVGLQLLQAHGLPEGYADDRLSRHLLGPMARCSSLRSTVPAMVSRDFADAIEGAQDSPFLVVAEAPMVVFALLAGFDGLDDHRLARFLPAFDQTLTGTLVGRVALTRLADEGLDAVVRTANRPAWGNLARVLAAARLLDTVIDDADAEKGALAAFARAVADPSQKGEDRLRTVERALGQPVG